MPLGWEHVELISFVFGNRESQFVSPFIVVINWSIVNNTDSIRRTTLFILSDIYKQTIFLPVHCESIYILSLKKKSFLFIAQFKTA